VRLASAFAWGTVGLSLLVTPAPAQRIRFPAAASGPQEVKQTESPSAGDDGAQSLSWATAPTTGPNGSAAQSPNPDPRPDILRTAFDDPFGTPPAAAPPPVIIPPDTCIQPNATIPPPDIVTELPPVVVSANMPGHTNLIPPVWSGNPQADGNAWDLGFLARGYYLNDQRIQWSGLESTFAVEGVLSPVFKHREGDWETSVEGEFYLNQPNDRNILLDTPERQSYAANFDIPPWQISQLFIRCRYDDLTVMLGKIPTPFGRTYFPLYTNSRMDAPFIRTECIDWWETGLLVRYQPGWFIADVAITNGGTDRDTNSSKALVSRVGIETPAFAAGASIKIQDGVGSDEDKQFDNYAGLDIMYRFGPWTLSGEAIYDQYGFRQPGFDPNDIYWGRSLYYRDNNYAPGVADWGVGYYVNLGYEDDRWGLTLNYGEFYPQRTGDPSQDVTIRRGLVKVSYRFTPHLLTYNMLLRETDIADAQDNRPRQGLAILTGLQYTF
jgi:hypothetical protein